MPARPSSTSSLLMVCLAAAVLSLGCGKSTPDETKATDAMGEASEHAHAHHEGQNEEDILSRNEVPMKPWDQERMTELSQQLADAMLALRNSFRNNPVLRTPDSRKRVAAAEMMDTLRNLDRHCRALATQVRRGGTEETTRGTVRRIGTLLRDANQIGRRIMTNAWTDERILPAMELVNEIAPFYGSGPIYDTENMTMIEGGPNPNRRQEGQ